MRTDFKTKMLDRTNPVFAGAECRRNIRSRLKNPLYQYLIFGGVLILVQLLAMAGVLQSSFALAVGSTLIYAIMAIGFCLLLGYSGLASLGTAGFVGIGSYIAFFCLQDWGLPYIVALLLTLVVSIVIGVGVGFISLRIEGIYLAIVTLGLSEILRYALMNLKEAITISSSKIKLFGMTVDRTVVFFLLVVVLIALMCLLANLIDSPTGRAMLAMKNSTSAAQAMGISLMKYRLLAFVISTVYAAVAGLMYMMYFRSIIASSSTLFLLGTSLNVLGAVIIGGARSVWGTVAGTFVIYGIQNMFLQDIPFFQNNPAFIPMLTGLLIILIVMFYPGGLAQLFVNLKFTVRKWRYKWRARKYGVEE